MKNETYYLEDANVGCYFNVIDDKVYVRGECTQLDKDGLLSFLDAASKLGFSTGKL